jgi:hypothetical protein
MSYQNQVTVLGSNNLTPLEQVMQNVGRPGAVPYYEQCKQIYAYHVLGKVVVDKIIDLALSQERIISIDDDSESAIIKIFNETWDKLNATSMIAQVLSLSRIYGAGALVLDAGNGEETDQPIDYAGLAKQDIKFKAFDPLIISGSLSTYQDPLDPDFQGVPFLVAQGKIFHHTRSFTVMNESPIYLQWTTSAFGYTGRSVYQRALYPMKTYLMSMTTDNYVLKKAGMEIFTSENVTGSLVDQQVLNNKKNTALSLKYAEQDNVAALSTGQTLTSFDLMNIEGPTKNARSNALKDIASATNQAAALINQETLTSGFGEGSEDAKMIEAEVDKYRKFIKPIFKYVSEIVMYKAWSAEFYESLQNTNPEYVGTPYEVQFHQWMDGFDAKWPSFQREPDSDKIKVDEVQLKNTREIFDVLIPRVGPKNKRRLIQWVESVVNSCQVISKSTPLELDPDELEEFQEKQAELMSPDQLAIQSAYDENIANHV